LSAAVRSGSVFKLCGCYVSSLESVKLLSYGKFGLFRLNLDRKKLAKG